MINQKSTKIETDMKIKINVLQNRQVTIGTIHDDGENYEVHMQKVMYLSNMFGGDW